MNKTKLQFRNWKNSIVGSIKNIFCRHEFFLHSDQTFIKKLKIGRKIKTKLFLSFNQNETQQRFFFGFFNELVWVVAGIKILLAPLSMQHSPDAHMGAAAFSVLNLRYYFEDGNSSKFIHSLLTNHCLMHSKNCFICRLFIWRQYFWNYCSFIYRFSCHAFTGFNKKSLGVSKIRNT